MSGAQEEAERLRVERAAEDAAAEAERAAARIQAVQRGKLARARAAEEEASRRRRKEEAISAAESDADAIVLAAHAEAKAKADTILRERQEAEAAVLRRAQQDSIEQAMAAAAVVAAAETEAAVVAARAAANLRGDAPPIPAGRRRYTKPRTGDEDGADWLVLWFFLEPRISPRRGTTGVPLAAGDIVPNSAPPVHSLLPVGVFHREEREHQQTDSTVHGARCQRWSSDGGGCLARRQQRQRRRWRRGSRSRWRWASRRSSVSAAGGTRSRLTCCLRASR